MAISRKDRIRKERRETRVRAKQKRGFMPRISVFRSLKHIYGQIINDVNQKTIVSAGSISIKNITGDKKQIALAVGKVLALRAKEQGINQVVFDRGPYRYHGRVKAFAEGLREGGLQI